MQSLILALAGAYLALLGAKLYGTARTMRSLRRPVSDIAPNTVTLLTPVLSGDPDLRGVLDDNVHALADQRFFWLVDVDDTEGQRVARAVQAAHPGRAITVIDCQPAPPGVNPKTFKLDLALEQVQTPLFLVLDDDARLPRVSLLRMVDELGTAELVTGLPFYRGAGPLASRLLAQFVNNNAALTYLALLPWRRPVSINGMCYLMRADWFRTLGGFAPLRLHLADDLAVATRLIEAHARIHQSIACVAMHTSVCNATRYIQQMHRWFLFTTLLMRAQPRAINLLITLLYGIHPILFGGLLAIAALAPNAVTLSIAVMTCAARALGLIWVQHRLTGQGRHRPLLSIVSELLQPLHLLHGFVVRRIRWRTRRYRVRANDDFEPY